MRKTQKVEVKMRKNILSELDSRRSFMTPAERRIADFILRDPRRLTELSMSALAENCSVSQGSVVNFSKKLSGGGFPTLKLRVAEAVAISPNDTAADGKSTEMQKMSDRKKSHEKICKHALTNSPFVCIIVCICFHALHIYAESVNI